GTVTTSYNYKNSDKNIKITSEVFVSRKNKNLAAIKLVLNTDFNGKLKISFPLFERAKPYRKPYAILEKIEPNLPGSWPKEWYPGFAKVISAKADEKKAYTNLICASVGKKDLVVEAAKIDWEGN